MLRETLFISRSPDEINEDDARLKAPKKRASSQVREENAARISNVVPERRMSDNEDSVLDNLNRINSQKIREREQQMTGRLIILFIYTTAKWNNELSKTNFFISLILGNPFRRELFSSTSNRGPRAKSHYVNFG